MVLISMLLLTLPFVTMATTWFRFDVYGADNTCKESSLASGGWLRTGVRGSFADGTDNTIPQGACNKIDTSNFFIDCSSWNSGTGTIGVNVCTDPTCKSLISCLPLTVSAGACTNLFNQAPLYLGGICQDVDGVEPPAVPSLPFSVSVRDTYAQADHCVGTLQERFWYTPSACDDSLNIANVGNVRDCRSGVGIEHTCSFVDAVTCSNCEARSITNESFCDIETTKQESHRRYCLNPSAKTSLMAAVSYFPRATDCVSGGTSKIDSFKSNTCHDLTSVGLGWFLGDCDSDVFYTDCTDFRCIASTCTKRTTASCLSVNGNQVSLSCAAAPTEGSLTPLESQYLLLNGASPSCSADNVLDRVTLYTNGGCNALGDGTSVKTECISANSISKSVCSDSACTCLASVSQDTNQCAAVSKWTTSITSCGSALCKGDFDLSGKVDVTDLATLLVAWGPGDSTQAQDFDANGRVDVTDLADFLVAWGPC